MMQGAGMHGAGMNGAVMDRVMTGGTMTGGTMTGGAVMDAAGLRPRLLLIGAEPVLLGLLRQRLGDPRWGDPFEIHGSAAQPAEVLALARAAAADLLCVDADLVEDDDQPGLVARLVLVSAAPVVVLSAAAATGAPVTAALFQAGAAGVLHKPRGRLPLDLEGEFGAALVATLVATLDRATLAGRAVLGGTAR